LISILWAKRIVCQSTLAANRVAQQDRRFLSNSVRFFGGGFIEFAEVQLLNAAAVTLRNRHQIIVDLDVFAWFG
jgi:hypothetical protein